MPEEYIQALKLDWEQSIQETKEPIQLQSIYLGGGTPSLLSNEQLEDLLKYFSNYYDPKTAEITLEANPTSLLENKLNYWVQIGINRISMGVQSFSAGTLKYLTRTHSPHLSKVAVERLRTSPVRSFNIDLMMGMKTQTVEEFAEDLQYLLAQSPKHISIYELTIEENTPFHKKREQQRNEEDIAEMMRLLEVETEKAGVYRYEISNFAQTGHQSAHNLIYWHNQPYFGIGCGAFSFVNRNRFSKEKNVDSYIQKMLKNTSPITFTEHLTDESYARETLMVGLRLVAGRNLQEFYKQTSFQATELLGDKLKYFEDLEMLAIEQGNIKLTKKGLRVANSILSEFI